jgi:hypothetical protein
MCTDVLFYLCLHAQLPIVQAAICMDAAQSSLACAGQ